MNVARMPDYPPVPSVCLAAGSLSLSACLPVSVSSHLQNPRYCVDPLDLAGMSCPNSLNAIRCCYGWILTSRTRCSVTSPSLSIFTIQDMLLLLFLLLPLLLLRKIQLTARLLVSAAPAAPIVSLTAQRVKPTGRPRPCTCSCCSYSITHCTARYTNR